MMKPATTTKPETLAWADLGRSSDLSVIILSICRRHQRHKVPTHGPYNLSPGLTFGATCAIFRAGARPKAPGAHRGPQGAQNRPKIRCRISHFILPKVCPRARRGYAGLQRYCRVNVHPGPGCTLEPGTPGSHEHTYRVGTKLILLF